MFFFLIVPHTPAHSERAHLVQLKSLVPSSTSIIYLDPFLCNLFIYLTSAPGLLWFDGGMTLYFTSFSSPPYTPECEIQSSCQWRHSWRRGATSSNRPFCVRLTRSGLNDQWEGKMMILISVFMYPLSRPVALKWIISWQLSVKVPCSNPPTTD